MITPPPPAELAWLSDLIGADATLRLIETHGGTRVHVPRQPNQGSRLSRLIGLPQARALAEVHGGIDIKVPIARAWRVRLYRERGETWRQIARRLGMTESQVGKILQAAGATTRQMSLFD